MKYLILIFLLLLSNCSKGFIIYSPEKKVQKELNNHLKQEADNAFINKDYNRAASLYHDLYLSKNSPEDLLKEADSYRFAGECSKAIDLYDKLDKSPQEIIAKEGKALCLLQDGEYINSVSLFKEIIDKDVTRWRTLNALAIIFAMNDHYKEAINYFDIALEFTDKPYIVANNKALALAKWGKIDESINILENILNSIDSHNSNKQKISLNLALFYSLKGEFKKSENICKKYLSGEALYQQLALYAELSKNKKKTKEYLSKAITS